jgi:hypothetical protein
METGRAALRLPSAGSPNYSSHPVLLLLRYSLRLRAVPSCVTDCAACLCRTPHLVLEFVQSFLK